MDFYPVTMRHKAALFKYVTFLLHIQTRTKVVTKISIFPGRIILHPQVTCVPPIPPEQALKENIQGNNLGRSHWFIHEILNYSLNNDGKLQLYLTGVPVIWLFVSFATTCHKKLFADILLVYKEQFRDVTNEKKWVLRIK